MDKSKIEFRKIKRTDYSALEKIIRDVWHYDSFASPKIAVKMSKSFLASCLANQNFTCVAVNNGEPVGVIMAKATQNHHTALGYALSCLANTLTMLIDKEGRMAAKMQKSFVALDEELFAGCGQNFDGEIAFFAIKDNQQGLGIGKELFDRALHFLKTQSVKNFFLYTDSTCNYGFYEHRGMSRLNEKNYDLRPYRDMDILFFLYSYSFEE